jgi:hypothetical protein
LHRGQHGRARGQPMQVVGITSPNALHKPGILGQSSQGFPGHLAPLQGI